MNIFKPLIYLLISAQLAWAAQETPQTFTLDGRLYADASGSTPLSDSLVTLTIQVLDKNQSCVLYEETQTANTLSSNGYFSVQVGSSTGALKRTTVDSGNSMAVVFANSGASILGKQLSDLTTVCFYTPAAGEARYVRVQVKPSSDNVTRVLTPYMAMTSIPSAVVAERAENLQGLTKNNFLQVNSTAPNSLTQTNLESVFTSTNFSRLTTLLSVPPSNYVQNATNGAATLPSVSGDPSSGLTTGQIWYDSVSNTLKYYDGSVKTLGAGGGSGVTSIATGAGLLGGTITSTGTLSVDVGTTAGKIVQVQTGGKLPTLDGSNLTGLTASQISSGTLTIAQGGTGQSTKSAAFDALSPNTTKGDITVRDGSGNVRLPIGSNGQVLMADSSQTTGVKWGNAATGTLTNVTGGTGLTGGSITTSGTINVDVGTGANQIVQLTAASKLPAVDGSLLTNLTASQISAGTLSVAHGGTGNGSFQAHGVIVSDLTGSQLQSLNCSSGQVLKFDASGYAICGTDNGTSGNEFINGGNSFTATANLGTNDAYALNIKTNNTTRMTFDNAGNIGIGTISPWSRLHVDSGDILITGTDWAGYNNTIVSDSASPYISFRRARAGWLYANSGDILGEVGFKTASGASSAQILVKATETQSPTAIGSQIQFLTGANNTTTLTPKMIIDQNGNVGIGTTSPSVALQVEDAATTNNAVGSFFSPSLADGNYNFISVGTSNSNFNSGTLAFSKNAAGSVSNTVSLGVWGNSFALNVNGQGKVGIGTSSPNSVLDVNGALTLRGIVAPAVSSTGQGMIYFDSSANKFKVSENGGGYVDLVGSGGTSSDATYSAKGIVQFNTDAATSGISLSSGVATVNSGTGANQIVKLDGSAKLPAVDGSGLTNLNPNNLSAAVPISLGGTGQTSQTAGFNALSPLTTKGDLIVSNGTNNIRLPAGTNGQVLSADSSQGSGLKWIAAGGTGTVTNVTAGTGLTGGSITSTGTLNVDVGTGANQIVQLTAASKLPAVDGSLLTNLTASQISAGTLPINRGGTGNGSFAAHSVIVSDLTGSQLQSLNCTSGQVLKFDVSGYAVCGTDNGGSGNEILKNGNSFGSSFDIGSNDTYGVGLKTNNTVRMVIDASGYVGIGTTTPGELLDINEGKIGVQAGTTSPEILLWAKNTNTLPSRLTFQASRTNGTANPQSNDVLGRIDFTSTSGSSAEIYAVADENQTASSTAGFLTFWTTPTGLTSGSERMRIDSTGRVGIATTAPNSTLTVSGSTNLGGTANATGAGANDTTIGGTTYFGTSGSWKVDSSGVGVLGYLGVNYTNTLSSQLELATSSASTVGQKIHASSGQTADLFQVLDSSSGTLSKITATGGATFADKVGVGISSPATSLDIGGAASMRGMAAPTSAPAGQGRIYFDSTANKFKVSENGGGYVDLVGSGGTSSDATYSAKGIVQFNTDAATSGISLSSGVATVNSGTGANQIVKLDASAKLPAVDGSLLTNLTASQISAGTLSVARGGTGNSSFAANGVVVSNLTGSQLQTLNCSSGQVIKFDSSGYAVCGTVTSTTGTEFLNGGNSFGAAANLGTNDNYALNFKTNNTTRMTVDNVGNVGIGTTSPAYSLDVSGYSRSSYQYLSNSLGYQGAGAHYIKHEAGSANTDSISFRNSSNVDLMTVLMSGNVGIGTASPSSDLHIVGSSDQTHLLIKANSTQTLDNIEVLNSSGTLLFGVTSGGAVKSKQGTAAAPSYTFISDTSTGILNPSAGNLAWTTSGTERMRLDSNGNLGVGFSSPSFKLDVSNTGLNANQFYDVARFAESSTGKGAYIGYVANSSGNGVAGSYLSTMAGDMWLGVNADPRRITVQATTGNVGIGTLSPNTVLDVGGAESMRGMAAPALSPAGQGRIYFDSSANKFKVSENNGAYVDLVGASGGGSYLSASGGTLSGALTVSSGGISNTGGFNNNSGTITNAGTISGVTSVTGTGAMTMASGGTNTNLTLSANGTGSVNLTTGNGTGFSVLDGPASTVNYVTVKGAATGGSPVIGTAGGDTNINLTLSPKGSGNTVFSSGNVGIGTSSPSSKLEVSDTDSTVRIRVMNKDSSVSQYPSVDVFNHMGTPGTGYPQLQVINYRGNSSSTLPVQQYDYLGALNFGGGYNTTTGWVASASIIGVATETYSSSASGSALTFRTTSNGTNSVIERMRVDQNGNVGIGTSTPGTRLDVNGTAAPINSAVGIMAVSSTDGYAADKGGTISLGGKYDGSINLKTFGVVAGFKENGTSGDDAGYLAFGTRPSGGLPTEKVRISSTGNVGIGTTSPVHALQVNGSALIGAPPATLTTTSGSHTATATTITVGSTAGYPSSGILYITDYATMYEAMSYTGTTATTFTGVTRGLYGVAANTIPAGSTVDIMVVGAAKGSNTTEPAMFVTSKSGTGFGAVPPWWMLNNGFYAGGNFHAAGIFVANQYINFGMSSVQINGYSMANSTDFFSVTTNSAERFRADGSGNFGVNTSTPRGPLEVNTYPNLKVPGSGLTAGATSMTVAANTWPASGTLIIDGEQISYTGGGTTTLTLTRGVNSTSAAWHGDGTPVTYYGASALLVSSAGNVGIGTTSPSAALHIRRDVAGVSDSMIIHNDTAAGNWVGSSLRFDGVGNLTTGRITSIWDGPTTNQSDMFFSVRQAGADYISMALLFNGNVGVGTSFPRATLDVNGAIVGKASTPNATSTVDFAGGNIQHTTLDCGSFTLKNLKDGGSYMFIVKGTNVATCSFTAFSDSGSTSLTVHMPPGHGATTSGKHTLYNLAVSGGDVYLAWTPGY